MALIQCNLFYLVPDPCVDLICLNGGTCIDQQSPANDSADLEAVHPRLLADFYCQCALGFTGKRCESKRNLFHVGFLD